MDDFIVSIIINSCAKVGKLFLADFIGIDRFWMGVYMLIILGGTAVGAILPMLPKGKRHVH